ncbi:MAG: Multi-copper polyphenol oxidoreductase laccase [Ignavibacteria bacterium]|nr:MAG: Multi-copper polyphenol oxidoreductase laccase [Ignavibacteria bacterium]KAF0160915.1 MAG: Multi-copper polyphenol oxidoreductase laccase [Ignavibacteria bacterium]
MNIIRAKIFEKFPFVNFGFSSKLGYERQYPFYFNMSLTVGDDANIVKENREVFLNQIGLTTSQVAFQKQIHSNIITVVDKPGVVGESDSLITTKLNIGLAISAADCASVFIYDSTKQIIAGIHSGWRGTQKQIVLKTLQKLAKDFNSQADDLFVYVGPSISQMKYEVGSEVADLFNTAYVLNKNGKLYLDVLSANVDMLEEFGVPVDQIEISPYCSFQEKDLLHSFRRDGKHSGRHLGVISLKGV